MAISIYDPRIMDQVVSLIPNKGGFFKQTFFPRSRPIEGTKVDVDFYKGKRRLAPFVSPRSQAPVIEKTGYKTNTFETPLVRMKDVTTIEDVSVRVMGEGIQNSGMTREDRALIKLTETLSEFQDMIDRRVEWMMAQAFFTGKIPVVGEGVDYEIDFGFTNTTDLTTPWSTSSTAILSDLETAILDSKQNGYRTPNICIMSRDVADVFINNATILAVLDIKNLDLATIAPAMLDENVTYIGRIPKYNLSIYVYDEWYVDANGTEQPLVPAKTLLLASTNAKTSIYYGEMTVADPSDQNGLRSIIGERTPEYWVQKDPVTRYLALQSRPLPVTHEVDSWQVMKVLD